MADIDFFSVAWLIEPEPIEGCEIKCPECNEWSNVSDWAETEVGCEDCGSHEAIGCPKCGEEIDHVYSDGVESRKL